MEKKYSTTDVIKALAEKYDFQLNGDTYGRLRKKLERVCKDIMVNVEESDEEISLWDASKVSRGERLDHFFTHEELQILLINPDIETYVKKQIWDGEKIEKHHKAQEKNEQFQKFLASFDPAEYYATLGDGLAGPSQQEIENKKLQIMIEAIFFQFYKSFNIERLTSDMWELATTNEDGETIQSIAARERLENPIKGYCEK